MDTYPLLHNTLNSLPFHTSQRPSHFNHDVFPTVHIRRLSSPVSIVPPFHPVFFPLLTFLWPHAFRLPRFAQRDILFHVLPHPQLEIPEYRSLLRILRIRRFLLLPFTLYPLVAAVILCAPVPSSSLACPAANLALHLSSLAMAAGSFTRSVGTCSLASRLAFSDPRSIVRTSETKNTASASNESRMRGENSSLALRSRRYFSPTYQHSLMENIMNVVFTAFKHELRTWQTKGNETFSAHVWQLQFCEF
jgi:hypothetical protein